MDALAYYSTRPRELYDRLLSEAERRREVVHDRSRVPPGADTLPDALHDFLGVPRECDLCVGFDEVYRGVLARVPGANFHDSGLGTVRGVWTLTRHLRPDVVVETGVARGFSSATILAALAANGHGELHSIDLPEVGMLRAGHSGCAVPEELLPRWHRLYGGSRRLLPQLLRQLGSIDLFVHDSLHTKANMAFEMRAAWQSLAHGGALLVDDADVNAAFPEFANEAGAHFLLREQGNRAGAFGVIRKP